MFLATNTIPYSVFLDCGIILCSSFILNVWLVNSNDNHDDVDIITIIAVVVIHAAHQFLLEIAHMFTIDCKGKRERQRQRERDRERSLHMATQFN